MIKTIQIILTVLLTSLFFFPVGFTFLPGLNSKNLLAAVGLVVALLTLARNKDFSIPLELIVLLFLSGMVSLLSLVSITYNQTPDNTYVSFIRSTAIWLSSAFTVAYAIRGVHGRIDVPLVVHYLIGASLFQCASAMLIEFVPSFSMFVDRYFDTGQTLLKDLNRLYGIGASLDVAGSRFSSVLTALAFLLTSSQKKVSSGLAVFYTLSFIVIAVIGNMIARTTTVGMLIGLAWLPAALFISRGDTHREGRSGTILAVLATTALLVFISVLLYNTSPQVKEFFRFGFEGFFNYFEQGEWETASTSTLQSMVVWPEELRTWIIGDGYFLNSRYDPNYLGDSTDQGFYMGTDVGYLRFIFYFGLAGLVWIVAFIVYSAVVCCKAFPKYTWLFLLALAVGLVVWAKVSTDIFLYFAIFLCAAALQDGQDEGKEVSETAEKP